MPLTQVTFLELLLLLFPFANTCIRMPGERKQTAVRRQLECQDRMRVVRSRYEKEIDRDQITNHNAGQQGLSERTGRPARREGGRVREARLQRTCFPLL